MLLEKVFFYCVLLQKLLSTHCSPLIISDYLRLSLGCNNRRLFNYYAAIFTFLLLSHIHCLFQNNHLTSLGRIIAFDLFFKCLNPFLIEEGDVVRLMLSVDEVKEEPLEEDLT